MELIELKKYFLAERETLFSEIDSKKSSFEFCLKHCSLVEEYIIRVLSKEQLPFAVVASGGFCRRELSPFSDIDIMFIAGEITEEIQNKVQEIVTNLWDCGIEASHTVREFSDISKFYNSDLHAFTQFLETRFLLGKHSVYDEWNKNLDEFLSIDKKHNVIKRLFEDIQLRYKKYGDSPKVLEPNIKFSGGGLRDLQAVEWIYTVQNAEQMTSSREITQTQKFIEVFKNKGLVNNNELNRIKNSYELLLAIRNQMHLVSGSKNDRFEFSLQEKIAEHFGYSEDKWKDFMRKYFDATSIIHRFSKTMIKRFNEFISNPFPDQLSIRLDEDFILRGNVISLDEDRELSFSDIMRAFYYRGLYEARFDENLRTLVIEAGEEQKEENHLQYKSSVFFRELFKLEKNVAKTLTAMNEMGILSVFLPEFGDLVGYFQPGVYHCYTADEHTIIAIKNLEALKGQDSRLAFLYDDILEKDILYLSVLFHDIAKPISVKGHEIIGAEVACSVMSKLGYGDKEIDLVMFLVKHHLTMEKTAFRRNLNDAGTLNNFTAKFPSLKALDLLFLLTYADLSAVNTMVWTQWKNDQLFELYRKARIMLVDELSGEDLLMKKTLKVLTNKTEEVSKHVESIDDVGYVYHYTEEEIEEHVREIERGSDISVFFKQDVNFTNITVLSRDKDAILSNLCGALSINDLNIHDARIFTRKDGIIIDSFNVTDFRTHQVINPERFEKIEADLRLSVEGELRINREFKKMQSKWWRLENKLFRRKGKIKIRFEEHEKFTIIDISSPDRLGLLYQITKKMNDLGLYTYFAKISTKSDDVIDSFYTLDRTGKKIPYYDYEILRRELTKSLEELL
ncbi:MAG: HD domain-containing protein [Rhodothermaceae bacterium]